MIIFCARSLTTVISETLGSRRRHAQCCAGQWRNTKGQHLGVPVCVSEWTKKGEEGWDEIGSGGLWGKERQMLSVLLSQSALQAENTS